LTKLGLDQLVSPMLALRSRGIPDIQEIRVCLQHGNDMVIVRSSARS
jgi:hypothetical protein